MTTTVFFVGFSFYIPEDSTARIAVSVDQTSLPLLCCHFQRCQMPELRQGRALQFSPFYFSTMKCGS